MLAAGQQGLPNGLAILSNAFVLVASLYGFYRFALKSLTKLVNEQVLPPLETHITADNKQLRATNKVLRKLQKTSKAHDARFRAIDDQLARIEALGKTK